MTDYAVAGTQREQVDGPRDLWLGQLARAAAAGDRTARDALWEQIGARLTHVARHSIWDMNMEEQEDMAQEAFPIFLALVREWANPKTQKARQTPDAPGEGFAEYLFGLFRWRVRNAIRAERRVVTGPIPRDTTVAPFARAHEFALDLPAFLALLPEEERRIFLLRIVEGRTIREIAARLGLTDRTVRRYWTQTLRRLRALLAR